MGLLSSARVSLVHYLSYFNMTWRDIHSTATIHTGRSSPAPAPSALQDEVKKMMGQAVVFTTVLMAILAGTLWVVGLERLIRGRFTLFSMVRFLLRITFLLFLPLLSYMFSHAEGNEGQLQFVLLWMLLIQLIRKKVEAMVSSTDGSFSRAASRFKLMDHYDEVYSLVWIGYLIYSQSHVNKEYGKMIMFYILWSLALAKLGQRVLNEWKAQDSLSAAGSAHLIAGYMQHVKLGAGASTDDDPMDNCDYAVMGEEKLILKKKERQQEAGSTAGSKAVLTTPDCGYGVGRFPHDQDEHKHVHLLVDLDKVDSLVTVKQIWKELGGYRLFCKKRPKFISHMGLLCLSFSFFKLMRRRFEHYPMVEVGSRMARRLMVEGLLNHEPEPADNASRMFRVIQLELDFLDNYYQAGVPVVMSAPWLFIINFLTSFLFVFIYVIAAAILLLTTKNEPLGTSIKYIVITMLLVMILLAVEITDFLTTYLFSNWFLVHLICLYVAPGSCLWNCLVKPLICCFIAYRLLVFYSLGLVLKLTGRPINQKKIKIKQVSILQVCEPFHKLFAWTSQATLADKAKEAIVESLKKSINLDVPDDATGFVNLPPMRSNLKTRGETTTEIILAYHLATELLEMKHGKPKKKKKKKQEPEDSEVHRTVAVTLSRYCMYLVARVPEMLPDDEKWVSDRYEDVKTCLKEVSRRCCCSTWCCPWRRGHWKAVMEMKQDKLKDKLKEPTSRAGVELFQQMQNKDSDFFKRSKDSDFFKKSKDDSAADAWTNLANFWVELLIYLAPSNDVEGHAKALASSGGDLIACLWAFCTHAGISRQPAPAPEKAELHANELHNSDSDIESAGVCV